MLNTVSTDDRIPLTAAGRRHIEGEVARTEARLNELREALADAREDRSADEDERAAAMTLLDELGRVEARLAELRGILDRAVDATPTDSDVASVGSVVRLRDPEGEEMEWTLVTPAEAAPGAGRISAEAPLGRALVGHRPGETIRVEAPSGAWDAQIISIQAA